MGKTNWMRVFLGGLLAGIVINLLGFVTAAMYLRKLMDPAFEALGIRMENVSIVWYVLLPLAEGILAVWLYSAIRPRYGAGPKTAMIAGLGFWIMKSLFPAVMDGCFGLLPVKLLVLDCLRFLVIYIVATLLGAWVYKEPSQPGRLG